MLRWHWTQRLWDRKIRRIGRSANIKFAAFDILYLNGHDVTTMPLPVEVIKDRVHDCLVARVALGMLAFGMIGLSRLR